MQVLDYLKTAVADGASDLFIIAGGFVSEKIDRRMRNISEERVFPETSEALIRELYELAERAMDACVQNKKDNFSLSVSGLARFRVNVFHQRGSLAAVVRVIQFGIPDWQEKGIKEQVMALSEESRGLVLVTGLAGSGKSITEACLIDRINQTRECHIITIENPIEYLHRNQKSIISQQEVAIDVDDSITALHDCLLQSPDVIFLSEMQSPELIRTAIMAAETGRLVIGTLYAKDAASAIDYMVHSFPVDQQDTVRMQLSMCLRAIVSQQLLPGSDGSLIPAIEVMRVNPNIQRFIRENDLQGIKAEIVNANRDGMLSMDQSLLGLYGEERLDKEVVLDHAIDQEQMRRKMWVVRA